MARNVEELQSLVKALTYRVLIVILDFMTIHLMTRRIRIAIGFAIVSNIYTTLAYFAHERLWARIKWGIEEA